MTPERLLQDAVPELERLKTDDAAAPEQVIVVVGDDDHPARVMLLHIEQAAELLAELPPEVVDDMRRMRARPRTYMPLVVLTSGAYICAALGHGLRVLH